MLDVQDLTKWWGDILALDRVSFEVGQGEVVGFLGPNGAGKTTTMRIITGFIPPSEGAVKVDGLDAFYDSLAVRRRIGYLPENTPIYPDMRVGEYLRFRAQLKGLARRERELQVGGAMDRCMIDDVERRLVGQLSKGYRQRVGLADALLGNPPLLILDEPTAGMDPNQVRTVRKLIRGLGEKHTILLSTHILPEVEAVCSRVVIISGGRVVAEDEVRALQEDAAEGSVVEIEALAEVQDVRTMLEGVKGVAGVSHEGDAPDGATRFRVEARGGLDLRAAIMKASAEDGIVLRELRGRRRTLEDIFVRYTAREDVAEEEGENENEESDDGGDEEEKR